MGQSPYEPLEVRIRIRALGLGVLLLAGAVGNLGLMTLPWGKMPDNILTHALWWLLLAAGLGLSVVGFSRLSVARNLRWDLLGLASLLLMFPGIFIIGFHVMILIARFNGPLFPGR